MNLHKIMIGIGIILIVFIPIWIFLIVPQLEKLPGDYENTINYKRTSNTNHQIGGEWIGEQLVKGVTTEKTIEINGNVQIIEGKYIAQGLNNEVIWEVSNKYGINRKNRETVSGYGQYSKNSYYHFPTKLKKQSYVIWFSQYLYPVELKFKNIDNVKGLEAYHFEANNFIFDDSQGFEWLDLVPEEYKTLADGTVNVWVEPITGIILDYKGGGVAYYADKQTDEKVQDMQTWSNEYTEDTIANQVRLAQNEKQRIYLIEWIVPILLALVGIALIFASFVGRKFIDNEKPTSETTLAKKDSGKTKKPLVTFDKKKV
jgi:hypothetical protein